MDMTSQERNCLRTFCSVCSELEGSRFGQQFHVAVSKTYRTQADALSATRIRRFDRDDFRSFLLSWRKLTLQQEPANLHRVIAILGRYGLPPDRPRLRIIKSILNDARRSTAGVRTGMGEPLRLMEPGFASDTLINGRLFHDDPTRADDMTFLDRAGSVAILAFTHYVVLVYKQALRIAGSIRLRRLCENPPNSKSFGGTRQARSRRGRIQP
jgi:hypothetical protein